MANDTTDLGGLMEQLRGMFALNPMARPQIEQFWKAQEDILEETETFSKAWFERRHEAARTALEALRRMNRDGADASSATRAMVDWQQGSLRRLNEDLQQWVELCSRCAGHVTEAEVEAGKEGVEEVTKRAKTAVGAKHATPV